MAVYADVKDIPTVEMPEILQSFVYTTGYYAEGEQVHVTCSHEPDRGFPHIDILLDSGRLLNGEGLMLFQDKDNKEFIQYMGYRYLGTGVVHRRIT